MTKPLKPSEIPPHDGSVLAGAIHLKLTDQLIRERLRQMQSANPIKFAEMSRGIVGGSDALYDLIRSDAPIHHPLRVLLATAFDIECLFTDKDAAILRG